MTKVTSIRQLLNNKFGKYFSDIIILEKVHCKTIKEFSMDTNNNLFGENLDKEADKRFAEYEEKEKEEKIENIEESNKEIDEDEDYDEDDISLKEGFAALGTQRWKVYGMIAFSVWTIFLLFLETFEIIPGFVSRISTIIVLIIALILYFTSK